MFDLSLSSVSGSGVLRTPSNQDTSSIFFKQHLDPPSRGHGNRSLDQLAKEFGVDPHVVQALAERLANHP